MSDFVLTTPREADLMLARLFKTHPECILEAREDKAFVQDGWLGLGKLSVDQADASPDTLLAAVRRGAFEWQVPELASTQAKLGDLLGVKEPSKSSKIRRALDAIAAIPIRIGLLHPRFDPQAFEGMPFKRTTTVVVDTSGAIQGGLDFVAKYLHPAARVKIPAIVQMEIINFAERFLSGWRATRVRPADLLIDHLMSQGGQRVLLRLELHTETELERTFLLGDPIRSAFQKEEEPDLRELNLSVPIRSYVDRLVIESARQHQAHANPGHRVQLLTSDQGLARMSLSEGISPLFFNAVTGDRIFQKRLSGTILDPFTGRSREHAVSSLLWEIATAFGNVRLRSADGSHSFAVSAIGESMAWAPYQSHADLLWCDHFRVPAWPIETERRSQRRRIAESDQATSIKKSVITRKKSVQDSKLASGDITARRKSAFSVQTFNVDRLFALIDRLDNEQNLPEDAVADTIGLKKGAGADEYRRFLISGDLVRVANKEWTITEAGQRLAVALRNQDTPSIEKELAAVPSFAVFSNDISQLSIGEKWNPEKFKRGIQSYRVLGEVCCIAASISQEGLFPTPTKPTVEEFARTAVDRFRALDRGDKLVATGEWLEALIRHDGIHPEVSRMRINEASGRNLLRRSTEGSTTETRYDDHIVNVLRIMSGRPTVVAVHLYRGDYLIPGKSSSSIRIEEVGS